MEMYVVTLVGNKIYFPFITNMTCKNLKEYIYKKEYIHCDQQRILYCGKELKDNMIVPYDKINYLWRETDYRFFYDPENPEIADITMDWPWNTYQRINGNVLNVVSKKYINVFKSHYWLDICHYMLC